ncbi:MAG: hypothetical protein V4560_02045 [Bacteroidota bacterium]
MKVKQLLLAFFLLLFINPSYSQAHKQYDDIDRDKVYLTWHKRSIKFTDINEKSITDFLGKPLKIRRERSDHPNVSAITYTYPQGELNTEGGLTGFKITKPGWALSIKINNKLNGPYAVGGSAAPLKKLFPLSLKNSQLNNPTNLSLVIKKCDCGIAFILNGDKIKAIYFSTNDE